LLTDRADAGFERPRCLQATYRLGFRLGRHRV